jgi:hypothetical protein
MGESAECRGKAKIPTQPCLDTKKVLEFEVS